MAKTDKEGLKATVTRDEPMIEVEILPDVHAFIEGKEIKPGKRAFVPGTLAVNLVSLKHAKITGSK